MHITTHPLMTTSRRAASSVARWAFACALAAALVGCGEDFSRQSLAGEVTFDPIRPTPTSNADSVQPYDGDNAYVLEAQDRFRTAIDLHRKVIWRTCTPNGGVCHNQKEYPDLHTPANFLNAIGAPCNVQSGENSAVFDRCEQLGDRFTLLDDQAEIEIGYIDYVPGEPIDFDKAPEGEPKQPDATSPGLHIYLRSPITGDRDNYWATGNFERTFITDGKVKEIKFFNFQSRWWRLDDGTHWMAEVPNYRVDQINEMLSVGVVQGDLNRNGIYGATQGIQVPMINPGEPERSYLVARLRGAMEGEPVPGSRMPLANPPLTIPEMLAMFCFVEGLPKVEGVTPDLAWTIDYKNCSYSADPEGLNLLGEGVTWKGRVSKVLQANCGGCHGGTSPSLGLDLSGADAYEQLLLPSKQRPEMVLLAPNSLEDSYLWWKLTAHEGIVGQRMPYNPLTGEGELKPSELSDIETWIMNGAKSEE
jgi:hypothetical protein